MKITHKTIAFHDTDAAGIIFFANIFKIFHDAFESALVDLGTSLPEIIATRSYLFPIVHTDCDYRLPLRAGDRVTVEVRVEKIGTSSFTLAYRVTKDEKLFAEGRTVQVAVNSRTFEKISLPDEAREWLKQIGN